MKKINLIYWDGNNFGDSLSPQLIEEFSGLQVQYKSWDPSTFTRLKKIVKYIVTFNFQKINEILFPNEASLVAIGSVIRWGNKNSTIWGSGFMNEDDSFGGGKVSAVRGPYTTAKLEKMGYKSTQVFGDPAILLPLWIEKKPIQKYEIGIIPHWKEIDYFLEHYSDRYKVIDLRTDDTEAVLNEMFECRRILSSSLHGLIISHAYHIPALWIKKGYIDTDGFKFKDYFSSVDIPLYDGIENFDDILAQPQGYETLFEQFADKALLHASLEEMQLNLLRHAPFPLKKKYSQLI